MEDVQSFICYHDRLMYYGRIKMFSVQTTLGTWPLLGKQTCYNVPSDHLLTSAERGCSLRNSPKVNYRTAK